MMSARPTSDTPKRSKKKHMQASQQHCGDYGRLKSPFGAPLSLCVSLHSSPSASGVMYEARFQSTVIDVLGACSLSVILLLDRTGSVGSAGLLHARFELSSCHFDAPRGGDSEPIESRFVFLPLFFFLSFSLSVSLPCVCCCPRACLVFCL